MNHSVYPADPVASPQISEAFDAFAKSIAPYQWSSDMWEHHLDDILSTLRQYGHYPPDEDNNASGGSMAETEWNLVSDLASAVRLLLVLATPNPTLTEARVSIDTALEKAEAERQQR